MPILEAIPDENNIMIHKLVTLPRGTSKLPIVTANTSQITLSLGSSTTLSKALTALILKYSTSSINIIFF